MQCTLQNVFQKILTTETDKTISYNNNNNLIYMTPRSTMTAISNHVYVIEQHKVTPTTAEQSAALSFHGHVDIL